MKFEQHIHVDADAASESGASRKIVDLILSETGLAKPKIKQAMNKGAVWLTSGNGTRRARRADKTAQPGETIHLYYDDHILDQQPEPAELISDEGDYSIWYKPYGMFCQGSKWGDQCTINRWVETRHQPQKPAFIVHRLDRAASGLLVIAHKKKTATYFSELFQGRNIEKQYQAIVIGEFSKKLIVDSAVDGKPAYTEAVRVKYDARKNHSLLNVEIKTGRKHQIRRHLSEAGFPIVGDRLYGSDQSAVSADLALRSCFLSFMCPQQKAIKKFVLPNSLRLMLP